MNQLLLIVERVISHGQRRVVTLFPDLPPSMLLASRPATVILRFPDGKSLPADIGYSDYCSDHEWHERCFIEGVEADEIPKGTELWYHVA